MAISSTATICASATPRISWQARTTPARSRRRLPGTTWPASSSIRRRVRRRACACSPISSPGVPEQREPMAATSVEKLVKLSQRELRELCEAAEDGIRVGGGFGWLDPPPREVMESYWKGSLLVPERSLIIGRLEGV